MLQVGGMFGEYRVRKLLGKGGMGEVWLLEIENRSEFFAAKILDPELASKDEEFRKRFLREAELAMSIKHRNLVEVYDVGRDPDTDLCYIIMEYIPGGSLADLIRKRGRLPIVDAAKIVYQVADALNCIAAQGIVHRDIKPDNILFGKDGKVKIADLGIARRSLDQKTMTMTQTGVMMGTPAYMAPEQMMDSHRVDIRADIYSLGIVFYEMLAGKRPNEGDTVVQMLAKAMKGEQIPDVRTMRPEVSATVAELVNLMCAMDVSRRIATPYEVMASISGIVYGRGRAIRLKLLRRKLKGVALRVAFLAVAAIAAVAAGYAVFSGRSEKSAPTVSPEPIKENPAPAVPKTATAEPAVMSTLDAKLGPSLEFKDKTAVLTFANGDKLEFIKCPPGSFNLLCDSSGAKTKTFPARITREFWMSKKCVTSSDYVNLFSLAKPKTKEKAEHLQKQLHILSYGHDVFPKLMKDFGASLPAGYVFRLPSFAEFYYAYHANTTDKKSPYFKTSLAEIGDGELKKMLRNELVNEWGFYDMAGRRRCLLDRAGEDCVKLIGGRMYKSEGALFSSMVFDEKAISPEDPFFWKDAMPYRIMCFDCVYGKFGYKNVDHPKKASLRLPDSFHIVIGPDLVKEWRERNKSQSASAKVKRESENDTPKDARESDTPQPSYKVAFNAKAGDNQGAGEKDEPARQIKKPGKSKRVLSNSDLMRMADPDPKRALKKSVEIMFPGWTVSSDYPGFRDSSRSYLLNGVGYNTVFSGMNDVVVTKGIGGEFFSRDITLPGKDFELSFMVKASKPCLVKCWEGYKWRATWLSADHNWEKVRYFIPGRSEDKGKQIRICICVEHVSGKKVGFKESVRDYIVGWKEIKLETVD